MSLLDDSAQHLMNLATEIDDNSDGDDLTKEDLELTCTCFEEMRKTMQTKLEFLKFSADLRRGV